MRRRRYAARNSRATRRIARKDSSLVYLLFGIFILGCIASIPEGAYEQIGIVVLLIILGFFALKFLVRYLRTRPRTVIEYRWQGPSVSPFQQFSAAGGWTLETLRSLSPTAFERLVAQLMGTMGFQDVQHNGRSGDLGADVVMRNEYGQMVVVQCKKYGQGKQIGTPDLQKFLGTMTHYRAYEGYFVTTSNFSQPAHDFVKGYQGRIFLIDGVRLVELLQQQQPLLLQQQPYQ